MVFKKKKASKKKASKTKASKASKTKASKSSKTKASKPKATTKFANTKTYAQIGAEGEQRIHEQLAVLFGANNVFRNVYVKRKSGYLTEIDLIAIHPTGIYVVESKNYSGLVIGDGNDKDWTHIKGDDYKRTFYSPVAQNQGHIDALREACDYFLGYVPPMLSLLVFPDHCELQIKNLPQGLRCCRLTQLDPTLRTVASQVKPVLNQVNLQEIFNLFYPSQRSQLPQSVVDQHKRDVAKIRSWNS